MFSGLALRVKYPRAVADEIVPDDKNWTWVLEERCGNCGFDAPSFDATQAGIAVRDLAVRWFDVLAGENVRARPRPGVWSKLEYGCHVRDVFRKFDERLQLMLEQVDPHFENWDQDRTAIEDDYGGQDPSVVAVEIIRSAASLAARFDSVDGSQWQRKGMRSDGSAFTVRSIAKYLMHDPVHHLWDVGAVAPSLDAQSHRTLAINTNNSVWDILGSGDSVQGEDADEMTRRAYSAAHHWLRADGAVAANGARADWLIAKTWIARGNGELALHHAQRCLDVCVREGLADFDIAYAHEAMARSLALLGRAAEAKSYLESAREVPVADADDREIVESDLAAGPWFGLA